MITMADVWAAQDDEPTSGEWDSPGTWDEEAAMAIFEAEE